MNLFTFDPRNASADDLKAVQTDLKARRFYADEIDGDFGPLSSAALLGFRAACTGDIVDIALTQVGIREVPPGSNAGPTVAMYQAETSLGGTGWSWCAALQCWLFARLQQNQPEKYGSINRPTTAAAFGFENWGESVGATIFAPGSLKYRPGRGDFVIYTFSHIGVVCEVVDSQSFFAVEGNTNEDGSADGEEVYNHPRHISCVRCFVRSPGF